MEQITLWDHNLIVQTVKMENLVEKRGKLFVNTVTEKISPHANGLIRKPNCPRLQIIMRGNKQD